MNQVHKIPDPIFTEELSIEQFRQALPDGFRSKVTEDIIDDINNLLRDPTLRENFRDNLISYTTILSNKRRGNLKDYINAIKFVSFKLMGCSTFDAYVKTFPSRYKRLLDEGTDSKTMYSYSANYNKNKLVNEILEQSLIPTHILNADIFQEAINTQLRLMKTANSEKVQTDAANSILNHLKRPEVQKVELDLGLKEDKAILELKETTSKLAAMQKKLIEEGYSNAKAMAETPLTVITVNEEGTE